VQVNDIFYTISDRTATWDGDDLWYGMSTSSTGSPTYSFRINSSGVVQEIRDCSVTTTTTTTTTIPSFTVLGGDTGTNSNSTIACGDSSNTTYTVIDNDSSATITTGDEIVGLSNGFLKIGTNQFVELDNGIVLAPGLQSCPTTTTTTSTTTTSTTTTTTQPANGYKSNRIELSGVSDSDTACGINTQNIDIYVDRATLGAVVAGDVFYTSGDRTATWDGDDEWYGLNTTSGVSPSYAFKIDGNGEVLSVSDIRDCSITTTTTQAPTTTTTTQAPQSFGAANTANDACNNPTETLTLYITSLSTGEKLYTDSALTTEWENPNLYSFVSIGGNYYSLGFGGGLYQNVLTDNGTTCP